jgi:thiol-disulfide isomerase/thioredoxin
MKNILGILFLLVTILASAQNNSSFVVTGTLENIQNAKATLEYNRIPVEITNGSFTVKSEISEPKVMRFMITDKRLMKTAKSGGYYPVKSMNIWIILYPGAKINVKGSISDFADAYAYDGGENDILAGFHKELFPLLNSSVNIDLRLDYEKETLSPAEKEKLDKEKESLDNKAQALRISFLEKNVSSMAGLWLMDDMVIRSQIEMEQVDKLLKKVDKKYKDLSYYLSLVSRVKGYKATRVGQIAPDITTRATIDSSLFDLKTMRGKFVIIDFWGTWCGPCIEGMPRMKEFRDKHADKLQILGVAQDRSYDVWKKFVQTKGMNWPNVLVGKGEEDYVLKYNVQGFPTKILLSPEGKILYRFTGEEKGFYEEIEKLINK